MKCLYFVIIVLLVLVDKLFKKQCYTDGSISVTFQFNFLNIYNIQFVWRHMPYKRWIFIFHNPEIKVA